MERKFYPENFEKFLRGHADQFKMSPSKKVWHGIYNDLHPGRRWPSIAMSMLFVFTLVIVGHLNTNNGRTTPLQDLSSVQASKLIKPVSISQTVKRSKLNLKDQVANNTNTTNEIGTDENNFYNSSSQQTIKDSKSSAPASDGSNIIERKNIGVLENINENPSMQIENTITNTFISNDLTSELSKLPALNQDETINNTTFKNTEISTVVEEATATTLHETAATNILKRKKSNNVTWSYYIAPSLGYRSVSDSRINNAVLHKPMLGYEAGTAMSINIFKKLQLTSGLQLNYSGYNIKANSTHPIVASIALNSDGPGQLNTYSSISHYGNRTGAEYTSLKNFSLQASVPIGLQYLLGENDKVKFGAAASFQPSLIIASQAYMLSTDRRNYLQNPDLLRQWNMNTHLSTYVAFKSSSFNWQIGPQVRYQLLSTYTSRYPVKENLLNYGIRLGISKISK